MVTPTCGKIALLRCQYRCIPSTFVPKAERQTYFWKNVGGSILVKALQLSERQFNFKPTALAILPQTRNDIFLCWQINQKSNNLDIFLKNYYIINGTFIMWYKKPAVGTMIYNHDHDFVSTIQLYLLWPIFYYKSSVK